MVISGGILRSPLESRVSLSDCHSNKHLPWAGSPAEARTHAEGRCPAPGHYHPGSKRSLRGVVSKSAGSLWLRVSLNMGGLRSHEGLDETNLVQCGIGLSGFWPVPFHNCAQSTSQVLFAPVATSCEHGLGRYSQRKPASWNSIRKGPGPHHPLACFRALLRRVQT